MYIIMYIQLLTQTVSNDNESISETESFRTFLCIKPSNTNINKLFLGDQSSNNIIPHQSKNIMCS